MDNIKNESIEIDLLLEAIYLKYGYDFRSYSRASIKRRIISFIKTSEFKTISALQHEIIYNKESFAKLFNNLSINVTEMFRDPLFYKAIRKHIIPELKGKSAFKIWHAGCATGEEVYSMAILLKEEGIYDKCHIYATDMDGIVLQKAEEGIYSVENIKEYTLNYNKAGGLKSFGDYYIAKYDYAILDQDLKKNILFSAHNLATDYSFGEMDIIICRNVLIYFEKKLQERVIKLFKDSLCKKGFLCLGLKESIRVSRYTDDFDNVVAPQKIYRLNK